MTNTNSIPENVAKAMQESTAANGSIILPAALSETDVAWMKKAAIDIFRMKDGRIVYHGEHVTGPWRISRYEGGAL